MATANPRSTEKHRIITHGNKDYKSSQLMNQLRFTEENKTLITSQFEFFPFTDLDEITSNPLFEPNPKLVHLIENSEQDVEVSAILVLISQKDIMSQEMNELITGIPRDSFYDYNEENEKDWWDHVILVFVSEEDEPEDVNLSREEDRNITERAKNKKDAKVKDTMKRNEAIKEFVRKSGGRYISIFENTSDEEILEELLRKIKALKDKIAVGQQPHSKGYRDAVKSFNKNKKQPTRTADVNKIDRSFIILGESENDKSELGNLLLGPRESQLFATSWYSKPQGAKRAITGFANVYFPTGVERENKREDNKLLQIVDLPHDFTKHSELFAKLRTSENVTFLIVLNILSGCLSQDELIRIKENIQICELSYQNVFENAIIIFANIGQENNRSSLFQEEANRLLEEKLQCKYEHVFRNNMLRLVKNQKYVYIDSFYLKEYNRGKILKCIFNQIEYFNDDLQSEKVLATSEDPRPTEIDIDESQRKEN